MHSFPEFSQLLRRAVSAICIAAACTVAHARQPANWVAAWAAAPQSVPQNTDAPSYDRAPIIDRQTVRQIIYPRLAGAQARIQISNRYGQEPLVIAKTRIARVSSSANTDPASDAPVTFHGKQEAIIAPGTELRSDPIKFNVKAGAPLAVSFYIDAKVTPRTWHKLSSQVNYVSLQGDHTGDAAAVAFRGRVTSFLWLTGVDVDTAPRSGYAVVAIGDSITDGMRSTLNTNRRWPDVLARRLASEQVSVVNMGISGNRLLGDSPCYGERLTARFSRDALAQPAVHSVIVLIGINDINFAATPPRPGLDCDAPHRHVTAGELIKGYDDLIAAAHERKVRIIGGTLTPANLPPDREAIRTEVNRWIRNSGKFDDVIDFDAMLRDPKQPSKLISRFDSGDHIHPSDAGYAEMGMTVSTAELGVTAAKQKH